MARISRYPESWWKNRDDLDGNHNYEDVSFLVMEAGLHTLRDGTVIEAGTVDTSKLLQSGLNQGAGTISMSALDDAFVFTSTNTYNDSDCTTAKPATSLTRLHTSTSSTTAACYLPPD